MFIQFQQLHEINVCFPMNSLVSAEKASIIGFLGLFSEIIGFFDDLPYVVEINARVGS